MEGGRGPGDERNLLSVKLESIQYHARVELQRPVAETYGRLDEIYEALVLGTRDYVIKNGFRKVLIGLSGGIDSALTAVIAVDALGPENVVGVTMPSPYTSGETLGDAGLLAENLTIRLFTVPIREIYEAYLTATETIMDNKRHSIAHENIQARIRGNILMALSNQFGWLVLTTGNKSEIAVGYCTLYGDMAGGFAVIKDVPKTLVFELSEYVNRSRDREIIPKSVISRPPTAELRPGQRDEDSLPPYPVLDRILHAYVEEDQAPDEIIAQGFDREVVKDVIRMVNLNEYKRRQGPPGVKITPKAFGRDRRLPITNAYLRRLD
jgi:NAD+ synthase (glutamine-hydrolysing)